jgi:hypothetical protein
LAVDDLEDLIKDQPDVIVAGTGMNGMVKPEKALQKFLSKKEIRFIAAPNEQAIGIFNELTPKVRVGAGFHLTC